MDERALLRLIRFGISDPGATVKRGIDNPEAHPEDQEPESLCNWSARAVLTLLRREGLLEGAS